MKTFFIFVLLGLGALGCEKELNDPQSGDTCEYDVVCTAKGFEFTFGDGYGTAYTCAVDEVNGAYYVPQALSGECVADGDPCGDGSQSCYVPQMCLTTCTVGEVVCSGDAAILSCVDNGFCDEPYYIPLPSGTACEK